MQSSAVGSPNDEHHKKAAGLWNSLVLGDGNRLVTTNYVVLEMIALVQKRRGLAAARAFNDALRENVEVAFVDAALHDSALSECLQSRRRGVSLVDHVGSRTAA